MKNHGLIRLENTGVDDFTSDFGIKLRRRIRKPFKKIIRLASDRKIVVERFPELEKDKQYIFASTHYFNEDIISNIAIIEKNAYILFGGTEQLERNHMVYAVWANGLIYVNRLNPESRKISMLKMERVLKSGSSVLIYPEGGWNDTENLPVQKLFPGVWVLSKSCNTAVVPISCYLDEANQAVYYRADEPINLYEYDKDTALNMLRDAMATMMWEQIEEYSVPIQRSTLTGDIHLKHMQNRKAAYMTVKWTRDVWDEELTVRRCKEHPLPQEVRSGFDKVKITKNNAAVMIPAVKSRQEDLKYSFSEYMHATWMFKDDKEADWRFQTERELFHGFDY